MEVPIAAETATQEEKTAPTTPTPEPAESTVALEEPSTSETLALQPRHRQRNPPTRLPAP
jgi:hypothetical protein